MERLQAKNGKQHNFQVDPETSQKLKHCRLFTERHLELAPSEGVLIRRAVALLVEHYDKLQRRMNRGKEIRDYEEIHWLKSVSEPYFLTKLKPISDDKPMMSYSDRIQEENSKVTLQTILKEADAEIYYRQNFNRIIAEKAKRIERKRHER